MRTAALIAAAALLSACAAVPSGAPGVGEGYEHGARPTSPIAYPPAQLYVTPQPRVMALPPRNPPAVIQSRLVKMASAELARWALPEHAATTVRTELVRGWMPEIALGWFYEAPFVTAYPGVCQVKARGVSFRVYREGELTYQQHLDPPLEPYQGFEAARFKVLGSTLDGRAATGASCGAALPYADWFEAPSAEAVFRAMQHMERARGWPGDYALTCTEPIYNPATNNHEALACDARAYLETLMPNLIKRIDGAPCEGVLAARTHPDPCWKIVYDDPRNPGYGSEFHVLASAGVVAMSQQLLPPH